MPISIHPRAEANETGVGVGDSETASWRSVPNKLPTKRVLPSEFKKHGSKSFYPQPLQLISRDR